MNNLLETLASKREFFQNELQKILSLEITPENIFTFFDQIVERLVALFEIIDPKYRDSLDKKLIEDQIIGELAPPELDMDWIIDEAIRRQQIIIDLQQSGTSSFEIHEGLILPPGSNSNLTKGGESQSEISMELIPRRITILYFLNREGIEYKVIIGDLPTETMIRQEPYYAIVLQELKKLILVCDQVSNATYIFDINVLESLEITIERVLNSKKEELFEIIKENNGLGVRIIESEKWIKRLIEIIHSPVIRKQRNDTNNYPEVQTGELNPWSGFWIDERGNHIGTLDSIAIKLGKTYSYLYNLNRSSFTRTKIRGLGKACTGYCLEEFIEYLGKEGNTIEVEMDKANEWYGFFTDETGIHYAPVSRLSKKLERDMKLIEARIKSNNVGKYKRNIKDLTGRPTVFFPFEPLKVIFDQEDIEVPFSVETDSQKEWYGFYTDMQTGKHYGSQRLIHKRLDTSVSLNRVYNVVKSGKLKSFEKRIKGLYGSADYFYSFEDVAAALNSEH